MKKYQINYQIVYINERVSEEKQINIANCYNDLHAKVRLEAYLKRKYPDFKKLIVVCCIEDYVDSIFGVYNNMFNEVFKK